jgi:hypothetical protein
MKPFVRCLIFAVLLVLVWWAGGLLLGAVHAPPIVSILFTVVLIIGLVAFAGKEFGLMLALLTLQSCAVPEPLPDPPSAVEIHLEDTMLRNLRSK